jgi:hypothetical protein
MNRKERIEQVIQRGDMLRPYYDEWNQRICNSECHQDGSNIMEWMDCCVMCGQKYYNADGTFDKERWARLSYDHERDRMKNNRNGVTFRKIP